MLVWKWRYEDGLYKNTNPEVCLSEGTTGSNVAKVGIKIRTVQENKKIVVNIEYSNFPHECAIKIMCF